MCLSIEVKHPEVILNRGTHLGFEWIVVHNQMGYRCGYVRVPSGHPWHGKDGDIIPAEVHGGITFAQADVPCGKGGADNGYWIGFDCAHSGDAQDPKLPAHWREPEGRFKEFGYEVRTQAYVENECRQLCRQAAEAAK